jgi:hypothetical protein
MFEVEEDYDICAEGVNGEEADKLTGVTWPAALPEKQAVLSPRHVTLTQSN